MTPERRLDQAEYLNTPRLVANDQQQTVWKWEQQEPFGANACNPDPDGDNVEFELNLRFPGQYFDRETNQHYNYYRDFDPVIGRYIQSDPIGAVRFELNRTHSPAVRAMPEVEEPDAWLLNPTANHLYGYANGSPVTTTDPDGRFPINVAGAIGAAAVNAALQLADNYRRNGGNISHAIQCIDLGNIAASAVVGFFVPGGFTALQRGVKFLRGGSGSRLVAATVLATGVALPSSIGLGELLPEVPLNRVYPGAGRDCLCRK